MDKSSFIEKCEKLIHAYKEKKLGYCVMPEDSNPGFSQKEQEIRLTYFTLPMALNYQRDSYKLWESALKTINDTETRTVFSIEDSTSMSDQELRNKLTKYKVALQPNKHISTWKAVSTTINKNWGKLTTMFEEADYDFLKLKEVIQSKEKKGFPYLSGPKIFNYWSFIMMAYGNVPLKNSQYIDIAPDTHITKCSVLLEVISQEEALTITRDEISSRWRKLLEGSNITPIQMHPPLWFWSRNNFIYKLD